MPKNKETSSEISTIASAIMRRKPARNNLVDAAVYNSLLADAQRVAGSALSQDQTKGQG